MKRGKIAKERKLDKSQSSSSLQTATTTTTTITKIDRYQFCDKCGQQCQPHLVISGNETSSSKKEYSLIDKCEHCGETKILDSKKCYDIIV